MSRSTLDWRIQLVSSQVKMRQTNPSKTASPNGLVELEPPRNRFQIVSANPVACDCDEKESEPVAPPRLIVTILPADWQAWMSDARKLQFGSWVPSNTGLLTELQVYNVVIETWFACSRDECLRWLNPVQVVHLYRRTHRRMRQVSRQ